MNNRRATGVAGEALAVKYLRTAGYTIVTTSWRCRIGEIDIVAKENDDLVFVEVRSRYEAEMDAALESIGQRKRSKLIHLAHVYLNDNQLRDISWRIDIVAVTFMRHKPALVEIINHAIGW